MRPAPGRFLLITVAACLGDPPREALPSKIRLRVTDDAGNPLPATSAPLLLTSNVSVVTAKAEHFHITNSVASHQCCDIVARLPQRAKRREASCS